MAIRPLRPCKRCQVATRNKSGWCDEHTADGTGGTASQRGYGAKWRRYRARYLVQHPACEDCKKRDKLTVATVVHHKQPVSGANDPAFWRATNHEALCRDCHEKTHGRKR